MWRLGRNRPAQVRSERTYDGERVSTRIVMARLESIVDRLDGVWESHQPALDQSKQLPSEWEGD